MRKVKYFKCPECGKKFKTLGGWSGHVDTFHPNARPEGYTNARFFYYTLTGKTAGSCIMCKSPTDWNEATGKYNRFCNNPQCKREYVKIAKSRMVDKYGKEYILNDPEVQRKMLAAKQMSGQYTFSDGSGKLGYVGTYEKDFLMMMDRFMHYSAMDILSPSPHTYYYQYENAQHFYIPDFYIPNLNLEVEIKASDNTHPKILAVDKVKEKLKDEMMIHNPKVNYIKINDKDYKVFFDYLLSLKECVDETTLTPKTLSDPEVKASLESALDYVDDDPPEVYSNIQNDIELEIRRDTHKDGWPIIFVLGSSMDSVNVEYGFVTGDHFNHFRILIPEKKAEGIIEGTWYDIIPDVSGQNIRGIGASVTKSKEIYTLELYQKPDEEYVALVTFVDDDSYVTITKSLDQYVSRKIPFIYNWDKCASAWLNHSNKYRYFCFRLLRQIIEPTKCTVLTADIEFNPTLFTFIDSGLMADFSASYIIDQAYNLRKLYNDEPLEIVSHERAIIEEEVLDKMSVELNPVLEAMYYEGFQVLDDSTS